MRGAVLVVEDDRELRELVRRYLERAGHAVHSTGSGAEAIDLLASGGVDLVVLDLGLPDVDGVEVLAAAHQGQQGRETPVVVLTARSGLEDRIDGLRRGADDYVTGRWRYLYRAVDQYGQVIDVSVAGVTRNADQRSRGSSRASVANTSRSDGV